MTSSTISYRPDINGLRAIAVLMVIFFHFYPKQFQGGFIGVDVFFVISSFLITTILSKNIQANTFSFKDFYGRRIRRILPLLYTVIFVSFVTAYFIFLPPEFDSFSQSLLSATTYLSNHYFLNTNDYFALTANQIPLLHTWSLAVEEQFYLLWPLLFFIIMKYIKNTWAIAFIVTSIFVVSLIFAIYCSSTPPKFASNYEHFPMLTSYFYKLRVGSNYGYYTLFSRTYELMLGAILALALQKNKNGFFEKYPHQLSLANALAVIGILLIIASSFLISEKKRYPGWIALIPDFGAALCIYAGCVARNNVISKFLSSSLLVSIGLISYSLYLWHWPILAFYKYLTPEEMIPPCTALLLGGAIFIISILTYWFIEKPHKKGKVHFSKLLVKYQVIPLIIMGIPAYHMVQTFGYQQRLNKNVAFLSNKYCFSNMNYKNLNSTDVDCIIGDTQAKPTKILLFGDSYAAQFAAFFDVLGKSKHFSVKLVSTSMCYPLLNTHNDLPSTDPTQQQPERCHQQIRYLTKNSSNYDVIILGGSWRSYLNQKYKVNGMDFDFNEELKNTLSFLSAQGKQVIVIAPIPVVVAGEFSSFIRRYNLHLDASIKDYHFTFDDGKPFKETIKKIINNDPNIYYFDVNKDIFSKISTLPFLGNDLLYFNEGHICQNGSEILSKFFLQQHEGQEFSKNLSIGKIIA